jgi:RNA polymerase sigma-70 factor (ECF subfamily)
MASISMRDAYEKHGDELVRFATGLVGPDDAADAVSSAIVGVIRSGRWDEVRNERAYLYTSVLNEVRATHRRTMRRRAAEALAAEVGPSVLPEVRPEVLEAVGRLTVRQRAVVFLAFWDDLTPSEIARRLGLSPSTVYRTLERAERRLRRLLHE